MKTNGGKINKLLIILFIQSFIVIPANGMLSGSKVASAWLQRALAKQIMQKPQVVDNVFFNERLIRNFSNSSYKLPPLAFFQTTKFSPVKKITYQLKRKELSHSFCSSSGKNKGFFSVDIKNTFFVSAGASVLISTAYISYFFYKIRQINKQYECKKNDTKLTKKLFDKWCTTDKGIKRLLRLNNYFPIITKLITLENLESCQDYFGFSFLELWIEKDSKAAEKVTELIINAGPKQFFELCDSYDGNCFLERWTKKDSKALSKIMELIINAGPKQFLELCNQKRRFEFLIKWMEKDTKALAKIVELIANIEEPNKFFLELCNQKRGFKFLIKWMEKDPKAVEKIIEFIANVEPKQFLELCQNHPSDDFFYYSFDKFPQLTETLMEFIINAEPKQFFELLNYFGGVSRSIIWVFTEKASKINTEKLKRLFVNHGYNFVVRSHDYDSDGRHTRSWSSNNVYIILMEDDFRKKAKAIFSKEKSPHHFFYSKIPLTRKERFKISCEPPNSCEVFKKLMKKFSAQELAKRVLLAIDQFNKSCDMQKKQNDELVEKVFTQEMSNLMPLVVERFGELLKTDEGCESLIKLLEEFPDKEEKFKLLAKENSNKFSKTDAGYKLFIMLNEIIFCKDKISFPIRIMMNNLKRQQHEINTNNSRNALAVAGVAAVIAAASFTGFALSV